MQKYQCLVVENELHCVNRDPCQRMGGLSPNAKQRMNRIKINDGKHFIRILGPTVAQHSEMEAGFCLAKHFGLPKEEQARQDALPSDTAHRLKTRLSSRTILPESTGTITSETRRSPKIRHFTTRKNFRQIL